MRNKRDTHKGYDSRHWSLILTPRCCFFASVLALCACAKYSFDINDNEIYSPPVLYTDFSVDDPALKDCLMQTIRDGQITSATELQKLQCSYSGIASISGISHFSRLKELGLKGNDLSDIEELLTLTYLEYLDISDNPIQDCLTLDQLEKLLDNNLNHSSVCN